MPPRFDHLARATGDEPVDQQVHSSLEPLRASTGLARKLQCREQLDADEARLQVGSHLRGQRRALHAGGRAVAIPSYLDLFSLAHPDLHRAQVRFWIKVPVEVAPSRPTLRRLVVRQEPRRTPEQLD